MKKKIIWLSLGLSLFFLASCGQVKQKEAGKIQVLATFYPMYEFTKAVVGDVGDVEWLIPAGTEPHDYEPSAKDLAKMSEADAIVYNSDVFETWMSNVTPQLDLEQTTVIEASQAIELLPVDEEDGHGHVDSDHQHSQDPHVWLDPVLAMAQVEQIQTALSARYPEHAATFLAQSQAYIDQLQALDQAYQAAFQTAKNRSFVTQHGAFAYLAKRYHLTQEAIAGLSAEEEPSPRRLAELKAYVIDNQIQVIYFEENASGKVAQTLAKETGVELAELSVIESLTKEQLTADVSYLSLMEENLIALQRSIR
ncbi:metal ABC transporter substrate-binding protein [Enterococcus sp. LJL98]